MSQATILTLNLRDSSKNREKTQEFRSNAAAAKLRSSSTIKELLIQKLLKQLAANPANQGAGRSSNKIYMANIVAQEVDKFILSEKLNQQSLT